MKTTILLFCLLGSTQSLPKQPSPASGLSTKPAPDQTTLLNQQRPGQVFPHLSIIPLTQWFTLGSDLQSLNRAGGIAPGAQPFPLALASLNGQQPQPQMLPIIVAQLGAQGTLLSSEELPLASQIIAGLLIHPLFPGGILPTSQAGANPDVQDGALPAGQTGANPATQGTTKGNHLTTTEAIDDDYEMTSPAGMRRGTHTTEEATTKSPNRIQ